MLDYLFIAKPQADKGKLKTAPIGSGPFKLESWAPGSQAVFVKNPYYWRTGYPRLDRVVFKFGSDRQASLLMYKSGQADLLFDSTWRDYDQFTKDDSVQTLKSGDGGRVEMILFNAKKAPFDNVKVRQAAAAALGRDEITDAVYYGQATPWCLPWPDGSIGYEASPELARDCPADPAKARRLLAEAGYPNGISTSIMTVQEDADVTQIYQQQLAKAGIKAKIESVEDAVFFDRAFRGDWASLTSSVQRVAHDSATSILLGVPLQNGGVSGFRSAEYGQLIDDVLYDAPAAQRKAAMRRLNEYLLEQDFILPIASQTPHYVFDKSVKGLDTTLDGYLVLEGTTN
jgi:ABC-type transport system substrate-binding protein